MKIQSRTPPKVINIELLELCSRMMNASCEMHHSLEFLLKQGGLPPLVEHIAKHLMDQSMAVNQDAAKTFNSNLP